MTPKMRPKSARRAAFAAATAAVGGLALSARAATYVFDGGPTATGTELGTAANWSNDTLPNGATNDVLQFNGTVPGNLSLTYNVGQANLAAATGVLLDVTAAQTAALAIDSTLTANVLRLGPGNAISVASGAGPVTFGNSSGVFNITLAQVASALTFTNNGGGPLTFNSDVRFGNGFVADHAITLAGSGNFVFNNNLAPTNGGLIPITKSGTGTLTFAGNTPTASALTLAGGTTNITGTHLITASTSPGLVVGQAAASSTTVNVTGTLSTVGEIWVGSSTAAGADPVGTMTINNGTVTSGSYLALGRSSAGNGLARGQLVVNSGSLTVGTNQLTIGALNNTAASTSVATLNGGITTVGTGATAGGFVYVGENSNGVLNVGGAAQLNVRNTANNGVTLAAVAAATGVVNLGSIGTGGGTIITPKIVKGNGTGTLNFHGGTLQANVATTSLISGLNNVFVYGEGATIHNGGLAVTVGQSLTTPTGNGVALGTLAVSGNGFNAPPIVEITGGNGTGATAVATIDAAGNVTGVRLTNPGTGYTTPPTFAFVGGGGTVAQSGAPTLAANAGGGVTFAGTGVTTLNTANTYTGPTNVTAGTLTLAGNASINGSSGVTVNGNGTRFRQTSATAVTPAITLTNGTLDGTGAVGVVTVGAGTGGVVSHGVSGPGTLTAASLTFTGAASTLFYLNADNTPAVNVTGALATGGGPIAVNTAVPASDTYASGVYKLFGYGTFAGSASDFTLGTINGLNPRQSATLGDSGSAITLTIAGDLPKWTGLDNGNWKIGTTGANGNWKLITGNTATDYLSGDIVVFDDTATGSTDVAISNGNVSPSSTTFNNAAKTYTVAGANGIGGAGDVIKLGTGAVTLATANTYTGDTVVTRGTLNLTGAINGSPVIINPAAGTAATLNSGGAITGAAALRVGTVGGATGVMNVTAGSVATTTGPISAGENGLGVINVTGGTVTPGQFVVAGLTAGGAGVWNISGGSVGTTGNNGGTLGAAAGSVGVMNVVGNGSYTSTSATAGGVSGLFVGEAGAGVLNVSGNGTVTLGGTDTSAGLDIGRNNVSTAGGVVNLGAVATGPGTGGGGTITTNVVRHSGTAGSGVLNFHGGTLRASAVSNGGNAVGSGNAFVAGLTAAYVWGEGATIDNSGRSVTIAQALLAPNGSGVNAIAVGSGGSGYVAAPMVVITGGGGTGATANAIITGGVVTGFVITNPGVNYTTTPTITLTGGTDNGTAATVGPVTRAANASGGVTFNGNGTTTLAAVSTFTGPVVVNGGTLALVGGAIGDAVPVTLNADSTLSVTGSETVGSLAGSGNVLLAGPAATLFVGGNHASTIFSGNITDTNAGALNKSGVGTLTLAGYNDYSGTTSVSAGTLSVANVNTATGTNATINLGSGAGVGTLRYTGAGEVTNKSIFLSAGAAANGGTLDMSGTGTWRIAGATLAANASQAHTLTLQGSTPGTGQIDGVISDGSATSKTSLLKQGGGTWRLVAANTYTGGTTVNGGTLAVRYADTVASAATPLLSGAGVNIQDGRVVFDYAGSTSPAGTIRGLLAASFADASTPGVVDTGVLRSSAATGAKGLGYLDNGSGAVTVQLTLFGDADLDGGVSINDFNALAGNFGQASGRVWADGDFDYDGGVSINDFNLLAGNFGQTLPAGSQAWAGLLAFAAAHDDLDAFVAITGVPEPIGVTWLAAGAFFGLRRRR